LRAPQQSGSTLASYGGSMKRILILLIFLIGTADSVWSESITTKDKLRDWRTGVWLLADGSYSIYTDSHYFVVSVGGDSSRTNLYCGASKIRITDKGIARAQTVRIRQMPGGSLQWFKKAENTSNIGSDILKYDSTLFQPGTCNIIDGVIYDSVTEVTDNYILLSTCNGDKEKIFSDGRSVYLPASGGEHWATRIETFK
jgi:hypothetical protein